MKITKDVIDLVRTNYLTLDELIYLYDNYLGNGWEWEVTPASLLKLKRSGLLLENNKVSPIGESIVLSCLEETPKVSNENMLDEFNEFWILYPRDDAFRHFSKTRPLRWNKQETYNQYRAIRQEYSHNQLLSALQSEIQYRADGGNENLFKYMKGSVNWLKEKAFLNFLDEEKVEHKNAYGKDLIL